MSIEKKFQENKALTRGMKIFGGVGLVLGGIGVANNYPEIGRDFKLSVAAMGIGATILAAGKLSEIADDKKATAVAYQSGFTKPKA